MSVVIQLARCKTCSRNCLPSDLLAGLCRDCLTARSNSWQGEFGLEMLKDKEQCFECHESHSIAVLGGYVHWDVTANCFALLCIPCSEKAIARAGQYRGTPFGRMKRAE